MPRGGGGKFSIQSASPVTSTHRSSEVHPNLRIKFFSSSASNKNAPAAPESFDTTHVMSSSDNSRGTVSWTSSYLSKVYHLRSPTWGILISGCFPRRRSSNDRLVFVQTLLRWRNPSPLRALNFKTVWHSFPEKPLSWNRRT